MNYQKLYSLLFNKITDAIEQIEDKNYGIAKATLIQAQQEAEELYLQQGDTEIANQI